jgi:hypothetical protein
MALNFLNNGYFAGSVGIGTDNPYNKTHITTSVDGDGLLLDYAGSNNKYVGVFFKIDNNTSDAYKKGALVWERTGSYNEGRFHFLLNNDDNASNVDLTDSKVTILSTGNVGIGTTTPVAKLDVLGTSGGPTVFDYAYATSAGLRIHGDESAMDIVGTDAGNHASTILLRNGNEGFGLLNNPTLNTLQFRSFTATADGFSIHNTGSGLSSLVDIITLEKTGNVGIGTTDPERLLHVNSSGQTDIHLTSSSQGTASTDGMTVFLDSSGSGGLWLREAQALRFATSSSEKMRIDSAGNVGIGTANPTSQLSIGSNAITTKKPTVIIADGVAGGSLVIRGLSPILSFDRTGASPENKILMDGAGLEFKTGTLDAEGDVDFKIKLDGKLQAPAYTQGFLQSDASGNIEISGGGTLPGGPYLPLSAGSGFPLTDTLHIDSSSSGGNQAITFERTSQETYNITHGTSGLFFTHPNATSLLLGLRSTGDITIHNSSSSEYVRFDQSSQSVGIGTTSPSTRLEVAASATTSVDIAHFSNSNDVVKIKHALDGLGSGRVSIFDASNNEDIRLSAQSNSWFNAGNVGIGTTSPQERLDVNTNSTGLNVDNTAAIFGNDIGTTQSRDTWIKMRASSQTTDRSWAFGTNQSGDFRFNYLGDRTITPTNAAASTLLTIKNTGNVGIGTTSPDAILETSKEVDGNQVGALLTNTRQAGAADSVSLNFGLGRTADGFIFNTPAIKLLKEQQWTGTGSTVDGALVFSTIQNETVSERARITSTGHLQVSTGYFELTSQPTTKLWLSTNQVQLYAGNLLVFGGYNASNDAVVIGNESGDVNVTLAGGANDRVLYLEGSSGNVGIGTKTPQSKLQVAGGIQMADDTATASAAKVGTMRYRTGTEYVDVTGAELVVNGSFATDANWVKGTGVTIASGVGTWTNTANNVGLTQSITFTANAYYRCNVTVSNYSSGSFRFRYPGISSPRITANGTYSLIIQANQATNDTLYLQGETNGDANVNLSIDNVSVIEVTAEDASYADMCMQTGSSTYEWVNIVRNTY